jgi:hypothetical protein
MFDIQNKYTDAIANFTFVEWKEDLELTISSDDLNEVVKEVAEKIITASQLRSLFSSMANRELSLRDTCYLVVQDTDKKTGQDTPAKIANTTEKAKGILSHVVKKLSIDFVNLTTTDLNVLALLFGIHRISDLAKDVLIVMPVLSEIEQMEAALNQLIELRSKYPKVLSDDMAEESQLFLAQVDAKIKKQTELLEALRKSSQTVGEKKAL